MSGETIVGLDIGGTNIRGGLVQGDKLTTIVSRKVNAMGTVEQVLHQLFLVTDELVNDSVSGIGIGIPGLVDLESGVVFDVVNIPSWKEVALQKRMQERYTIPVLINNDANCFALGEFHFGKGRGCNSMVGLTIGTGLGSGLILNKKLYAGQHCGAGEFGMIDYMDKCYEYYASGQYFSNVYRTDGEIVFKRAEEGNRQAIKMYEEMGMHLGNAIKMILYALDIELIIFGGSVRYAYPYISKTMWQQIKSFVFQKTARSLKIEISELENSGILGAASLHRF